MSTARNNAANAQLRLTAKILSQAEKAGYERAKYDLQERDSGAEARAALNAEFRRAIAAQIAENRAAGESTATGGGDLVIPGWSGEVIRLLKSYDEILRDVEDFPTETGAAMLRPQVSSLTASGAAVSENSQVSDGTSTLIDFVGQQSWGRTPTYVARLSASRQLFEDSLRQEIGGRDSDVWPIGAPAPDAPAVPDRGDLVGLLGSAAAESIGRQMAADLQTAVYAAATSGQEVSISTLTPANVAKLLAAVDPAYLPGARLYVSASDFATLAAADVTGLRHLADVIPGGIVPTNAVGNYASGSVGGPVLGHMGAAFSMRRAGSVRTQVMHERYADLAQVAVQVYVRADFAATGRVTALAYAK